jgi:poly-gamma-glutamate capsule biosynthesis protein CapA/YwtB (metallophosphatase superfamily)
MSAPAEMSSIEPPQRQTIRIFLCGDVMLGRGIDQVLPHPCRPILHESYVHSALEYVRLAEEAHGPIPPPVAPSYIWGAALDKLNRSRPDMRIINLETAITRSEDFAPKGINYRMSPENADCLTAAAIDCCALANNHILDWGRAGLLDTLTTLEGLQIKITGAGRNLDEATAPASLQIAGKGRVLIFSFAAVTSGTPRNWVATRDAPGVNLLTELSEAAAVRISDQIARQRNPHDIIVVSIHWGPNWGYEIPEQQRHFAHALIEHADVSIIHGHSSHHAKGIEVYRNRLILYGCGDFLNDYEGIQGYEDYRGDLALMYFADIEPASSNIVAVAIVPLQICNFRLVCPPRPDIDWARLTLDRESREFGTRVTMISPGRLALSWPGSSTT